MSLADRVSARTLTLVLHRVAHRLRRYSVLAGAVKQLNQFLTGADIGWRAEIGAGSNLYHPQGVVIGHGVRIGRSCAIQQGVTLGTKYHDDDEAFAPQVGDHVVIGAGAKLLGPIRVGDGATIGANAVVLIDVPSGHTAVGVPAVVRPGTTG